MPLEWYMEVIAALYILTLLSSLSHVSSFLNREVFTEILSL